LADRLTSDDKKRIVDLYEDRYAAYGYDVRTVGWGSRADQWLRFEVLGRGIDFSGKRILDVGCGLGDFVAFLEAGGQSNYSYTGIDLSSKLIEDATKRFGREDCTFAVADILNDSLEPFDVVVCSGALSFRLDDNLALAERMIARMFQLAREAVCVNFLSSRVDYQLEKNFHYEPGRMLAYALSLSRWVRLHHDYPLYEFTLQILANSHDRSTGFENLR
jgi:ubiquinone/menaquinone biosynthesis C-methylase UbiE